MTLIYSVTMSKSKSEWTPEKDVLLGTMPDTKLAQQLGLRNREVVRRRRGQLGIPSYRESTHPWTPENDALLGTMLDSELAKKLGVTRSQVWHRRKSLGKTLSLQENP